MKGLSSRSGEGVLSGEGGIFRARRRCKISFFSVGARKRLPQQSSLQENSTIRPRPLLLFMQLVNKLKCNVEGAFFGEEGDFFRRGASWQL